MIASDRELRARVPDRLASETLRSRWEPVGGDEGTFSGLGLAVRWWWRGIDGGLSGLGTCSTDVVCLTGSEANGGMDRKRRRGGIVS